MEDRTELVYEFLSEEGYRPQLVEGEIVFKYEGDKFILIFKDGDPDYTSVNKFIVFDFNEYEALPIYKLVNKISSEYICGKCTLRDFDEKVIALEIDYLGSFADFRKNFERFLVIINQMEQGFGEGLSSLNP